MGKEIRIMTLTALYNGICKALATVEQNISSRIAANHLEQLRHEIVPLRQDIHAVKDSVKEYADSASGVLSMISVEAKEQMVPVWERFYMELQELLGFSEVFSSNVRYFKEVLKAAETQRNSEHDLANFKKHVIELLSNPTQRDNPKLLEMLKYHIDRSGKATAMPDGSVELLSRVRRQMGLDQNASVRDVMDEIQILLDFKAGVRNRLNNTGHTENAPILRMIEDTMSAVADYERESIRDRADRESQPRRYHFAQDAPSALNRGEVWLRCYLAILPLTKPTVAASRADAASEIAVTALGMR